MAGIKNIVAVWQWPMGTADTLYYRVAQLFQDGCNEERINYRLFDRRNQSVSNFNYFSTITISTMYLLTIVFPMKYEYYISILVFIHR